MKSGLRRALRPVNQTPVPLATQSGGGFMNLATPLTSNSSEQQQRAYQLMSTVNSCVSLISSSTARTPWNLYKKQPADARRRYAQTDTEVDQRTQVVNHPALKLLAKPNAFYTKRSLFELDQTYMGLTGEYFWVVQREGGVNFPTSLWSVPPHRMEPVTTPQDYIVGWVYTSPDGREQIPLTADEVIYDKLPNPLNPIRGLGPVQSVLVQVQAFNYSSEWNRTFFYNQAVPYGTLTIPAGMEDDEFKQFVYRWREGHRGLSAAGRVGILEGDITWTPAGISMKDMDFANLQGNARDIVREAFRMHKVMLGTSDDVNRANAQTGEEIFASWIIVPELDRKKDLLNNVLLPLYGDSSVEFDYVTPVPPNREEDRQQMLAKATATAAYVGAGYDPHDVLEMLGVPDMGVVETATQAPALPPAWVPEVPGGAPAGGDGAAPGGGQGDDNADAIAALLSGRRELLARDDDGWDDAAWADLSRRLAEVLEPV